MFNIPERKKHKGDVDATQERMETESGSFARPAPPQPRRSEPPGLPKNQPSAPETSRTPDDRRDSNSVFVSNLSFDLEDPEEKMKEAFGSCGSVVQVRLVYAAKGAFRGYCYVQFEDELAAREALKLDRQKVDGRPMFVSPCVDKSKNPDFKVNGFHPRGAQ